MGGHQGNRHPRLILPGDNGFKGKAAERRQASQDANTEAQFPPLTRILSVGAPAKKHAYRHAAS